MRTKISDRILFKARLVAVASVFAMALPPAAVAASDGFGTCAAGTTAPPGVEEALDDVLRQIPQSDLGGAPGGVVSVHGPGWVYVKSIGVADPEAGRPIDCAMPFQIGSNTKMMTATVLMQLHEEGKLSVDDPLSAHLPDIAARLPHGEEITLHQLAQHTSGVFSYTDDAPDGTPGLMEGATTDPAALRRNLDPAEMIDFAIDHGTPSFTPGEEGAWSYSNTGFALLGMVIETIERRPIGKSFEERIFTPLNMDEAYMWNGTPRSAFGLPRSFLAVPFDYETTDWNMSQGWAAGGVVSTVDDMHRFIEALVDGALFSHPETLGIMQETVPTGNVTLFGYGIGLARKGDSLWGHGGQTLGFESDIGAFEDRDMSFVAWGTSSSNVLGFGALLIAEALQHSGVLAD